MRRAALGVIRIILENRLPDILGPMSLDPDLISFFHDRLKVYLRDKGARYDLIDAVLTEGATDILDITKRVDAPSAFLETEDGKNLLAGLLRAGNIVDEIKKASSLMGMWMLHCFQRWQKLR